MKVIIAIYCVFLLLISTANGAKNNTAKDRNNALRTRICSARPEYGFCEGHRSLWYYNPGRSRCQLFDYSNCGGNRNKFFSEEHCINFCKKKILS
ncbi:kunitz-type serine protease inhibitor homolog beta-bungarotoxin B5-B chain-like [Drosophila novamexicana]|uniref:kunitz-type serine protease inhibitor homolog beta-bungarotoxin B5-B chain-like n=1 Tax=Drosophila novamexicana TaxID=47314 RepID=UPI0011E5C973|nr:kunitz-type serine protease inhibitor homolog beta-bungarotoxin B5-B chain-like [Drosophila novamexicana]